MVRWFSKDWALESYMAKAKVPTNIFVWISNVSGFQMVRFRIPSLLLFTLQILDTVIQFQCLFKVPIAQKGHKTTPISVIKYSACYCT